ncbi:MAG TPA: hypothetical protein DCG53_02135 [Syntrophus sp. (in: bacteria)]|nr:hypothetical protein [Syntrophus sp. (in: bacteria)]
MNIYYERPSWPGGPDLNFRLTFMAVNGDKQRRGKLIYDAIQPGAGPERSSGKRQPPHKAMIAPDLKAVIDLI